MDHRIRTARRSAVATMVGLRLVGDEQLHQPGRNCCEDHSGRRLRVGRGQGGHHHRRGD